MKIRDKNKMKSIQQKKIIFLIYKQYSQKIPPSLKLEIWIYKTKLFNFLPKQIWILKNIYYYLVTKIKKKPKTRIDIITCKLKKLFGRMRKLES